jgi:hypothetical protein
VERGRVREREMRFTEERKKEEKEGVGILGGHIPLTLSDPPISD